MAHSLRWRMHSARTNFEYDNIVKGLRGQESIAHNLDIHINLSPIGWFSYSFTWALGWYKTIGLF